MAAELYVTWNMYFIYIIKYIDGEIKSGRLDENYSEEFANIALDASKIFGSRLNFKKSNSAHMYKLIIAQLAEAVIEKLPEAILNNAVPPNNVKYVAGIMGAETDEIVILTNTDRPEHVYAIEIVNDYIALVNEHAAHHMPPNVINKAINYVTGQLIDRATKGKPTHGPDVKAAEMRKVERFITYKLLEINF
jgi:hypothetical protein